ncbi:MAG: hypothetical protein B7C54_06850 [Acidimicrobiales bacterium mtb01]|nr:hypothetical protein [Actinomycetota bacterium]TEX44866.1 MAG: hypothetical protein B7C54_06850 [Acidimicrobiales bacterium mtb01]
MSSDAITDVTAQAKPIDTSATSCRSPLGTYPECPLCGGDLFPEHAHFKCSGCGWRDSCCD